MGKKIQPIKEIKIAETSSASFSENALRSAKTQSEQIEFKEGGLYACSIPQVFHGEKVTRGTSNRLFGFSQVDGVTEPISLPYSVLSNMYICKTSDLKGPIETEERTDDMGQVYHRPTGFQYQRAVANGNLPFRPEGEDNIFSDRFVLRCVGYESTVSAVYETDKEKEQAGHTTRELKMDKDNNAMLRYSFTYLFELADTATANKFLDELPLTIDEMEEYYKSVPEQFEANIKPWLR